MIVKDGELITELQSGKTLMTKPDYDPQIAEDIREEFQKYYSISIDNYGVTDNYYKKVEVVPCNFKG